MAKFFRRADLDGMPYWAEVSVGDSVSMGEVLPWATWSKLDKVQRDRVNYYLALQKETGKVNIGSDDRATLHGEMADLIKRMHTDEIDFILYPMFD